jgi:esterase/lipase superfamily enzyme
MKGKNYATAAKESHQDDHIVYFTEVRKEVQVALGRLVGIAAALVLAANAATEIPSNLFLLRVTVTDGGGRPLAGAEIRLDDVAVGVTDETGQYLLGRKPWPAVEHRLSASLPGFAIESRSVQLPSKAAPGLTVALKLAREGVVRGGVAQAGKPNYAIVPVFYVTDRRDTGNSDPVLRYASDGSHSAELTRGICEVSIPAIHVTGTLESPSWWELEFRPDPNRHVMLKTIEPLGIDPFYQKLDATLQAAPTKEAVVFIHGYNNNFAGAARQAAQLTYDLHIDGAAPILYSWPSKNNMFAYTEDEETVQWTSFHLQQFLEELSQRTNAAKVHIVAHSMGNRALATALQVIAAKRQGAQKPLFHQLVLAAPDIGAETLNLFAQAIRPVTERITMYASANDDALLLSKIIHGGPRAGEKGQFLLIAPGVDTIDASAARTDFLGHEYFSNSGSIIDDMHKILASGTPPDLRGLQTMFLQNLKNLKYWIISGK